MKPDTTKPLPEPAPRGLICPRCGCAEFRVVYTRPGVGGRIVRRRECRYCARRMTTSERPLGS